MISRKTRLGVLGILLIGSSTAALAVDAGFMDALQSDARPAEAKARDGIRRPAQVMELLGVESGMTVVDIEALGGWYTEVLSAAVGPSGRVIAQVGPRGLQQDDGAPSRAQAQRLGNVDVVFEDLSSIDGNSADAALTALNLHDYYIFFGGDEGVAGYLESIYNVLKPNGRAAIIDHEGSEGMNNNELHRIPAAYAKRMIEQAGFEIVVESDLLHTNADDHSLSIRDPSLGRNTDRFLFIVRKP